MKDWKAFWQNYRNIEIKSEKDLLYQVGKTVGGQVITQEQFDLDLKEIISLLELNTNDVILDLCCGNGLFSYNLSQHVDHVIGLDFSELYINNAKQYHSKGNIDYQVGDILDNDLLKDILKTHRVSKVLMNDCLAYFNPNSLKIILKELSHHQVVMVISSILDKEKKWKFYNTIDRKIKYFKDVVFDNKNSGIGYWWTKKQINSIAAHYGFDSSFYNHHEKNHTSHYRFNVKLKHEN